MDMDLFRCVNYNGEITNSHSTSARAIVATPTKMPQLSDIKALAVGQWHTLAIARNGDVYSWGVGHQGRLGHGDDEMCLEPKKIQGLPKIVSAACGSFHTVAIAENGVVYVWGDNSAGQCGGDRRDLGDSISRPLAMVHLRKRIGPAKRAACGRQHTLIFMENGMVWGFGDSKALAYDSSVTRRSKRYGFAAEWKAPQEIPLAHFVTSFRDELNVWTGLHHTVATSSLHQLSFLKYFNNSDLSDIQIIECSDEGELDTTNLMTLAYCCSQVDVDSVRMDIDEDTQTDEGADSRPAANPTIHAHSPILYATCIELYKYLQRKGTRDQHGTLMVKCKQAQISTLKLFIRYLYTNDLSFLPAIPYEGVKSLHSFGVHLMNGVQHTSTSVIPYLLRCCEITMQIDNRTPVDTTKFRYDTIHIPESDSVHLPPAPVDTIDTDFQEWDVSSLYDNKATSDLTLVVHGVNIFVHKVVLCNSSDFFRALYCTGANWKEENNDVLVLEVDFTIDMVKSILEFLYTDNIYLTRTDGTPTFLYTALQTTPTEVLQAASYFGIQPLVDLVQEVMIANLRYGTVIEWFWIATQHNLRLLRDRAMHYITLHPYASFNTTPLFHYFGSVAKFAEFILSRRHFDPLWSVWGDDLVSMANTEKLQRIAPPQPPPPVEAVQPTKPRPYQYALQQTVPLLTTPTDGPPPRDSNHHHNQPDPVNTTNAAMSRHKSTPQPHAPACGNSSQASSNNGGPPVPTQCSSPCVKGKKKSKKSQSTLGAFKRNLTDTTSQPHKTGRSHNNPGPSRHGHHTTTTTSTTTTNTMNLTGGRSKDNVTEPSSSSQDNIHSHARHTASSTTNHNMQPTYTTTHDNSGVHTTATTTTTTKTPKRRPNHDDHRDKDTGTCVGLGSQAARVLSRRNTGLGLPCSPTGRSNVKVTRSNSLHASPSSTRCKDNPLHNAIVTPLLSHSSSATNSNQTNNNNYYNHNSYHNTKAPSLSYEHCNTDTSKASGNVAHRNNEHTAPSSSTRKINNQCTYDSHPSLLFSNTHLNPNVVNKNTPQRREYGTNNTNSSTNPSQDELGHTIARHPHTNGTHPQHDHSGSCTYHPPCSSNQSPSCTTSCGCSCLMYQSQHSIPQQQQQHQQQQGLPPHHTRHANNSLSKSAPQIPPLPLPAHNNNTNGARVVHMSLSGRKRQAPMRPPTPTTTTTTPRTQGDIKSGALSRWLTRRASTRQPAK